MSVIEWAAALLMVAGAGWILLGTIGLLRFPDLFSRIHATGLGSTLGIAMVLLGVALYFLSTHGTGLRLLAALLLLGVTAPVGGHALVRAGYLGGVSLGRGAGHDDLAAAPHLTGEDRRGAE